MRGRFVRGLAFLGLGLVASGCTDRVPTLPDAGDLVPGAAPTTFQHVRSADAVVKGTRVDDGGTTAEDAAYRLLANGFDGSLTAHTLARFRAFPDTIDLVTAVDSQFIFLQSEVIATIPDTLQVSAPLLDFELWTVAQPWDSLAVSWENAVDRPGEVVPWTVPGGTPGQRLDMARWERSASNDSLYWTIPPGVVQQLADGTLPGLMVTLVQPDSRAQISTLTMRVSIQPSVDRDTIVVRTVGPGQHDFVFTPDPPRPQELLRVGGVTSDRSYVRLDISGRIPVCLDGDLDDCDQLVSPLDVSLNRVELLLDPAPVADGFRPIRPLEVQVRRVLEPELGDRAPLGQLIAVDTFTVEHGTGASSAPMSIDLTAPVEGLLREGETELAVALLVLPESSAFSYAWFAPEPRLRFVYTLPQRPDLP